MSLRDHKDKVVQLKALLDLSEAKHDLLVNENARLRAQVELYRRELVNNSETYIMLDDWTHPNVECDAAAAVIDELLDKTPRQCLASVKADTIDSLAKKFISRFESEGHYHWIVGVANKLREEK